ncbi:hypothetical protein KSP40_PGU016785 [Platanthera guangdongensis]|uniref:Secreted protein n=1 Tax=Platanthera guangdongensis TaxID=2320717 RepID=A0ABR2MXM7_9ASPA
MYTVLWVVYGPLHAAAVCSTKTALIRAVLQSPVHGRWQERRCERFRRIYKKMTGAAMVPGRLDYLSDPLKCSFTISHLIPNCCHGAASHGPIQTCP